MVYCDFHTHTKFSFDGTPESTPDTLCRRALEIGLTDLAITDHCDINGEVEKLYPIYDSDAAYSAVMEAKEKYRGCVNLVYGLELGNATQYPDEARAVLERHPYEFVIGSLHNLKDVPDFSCLNYENMNDAVIDSLFSRNIEELIEMTSFDGGTRQFTTIGHITYMHRYVALAQKKINFKPHYERIADLYKNIIKRDIALEINVSTLWKGLGISMPTLELLKLYRDVGGKLVTIGSDAHSPENLGKSIRQGHALLNAAGFHEIMLIRNGEKVFENIE